MLVSEMEEIEKDSTSIVLQCVCVFVDENAMMHRGEEGNPHHMIDEHQRDNHHDNRDHRPF